MKPIFIFIIYIIIAFVSINLAWKYNPYSLYNRIGIIEQHLNIAGHKIQDLQYQIDVLTQLQKEMK